MSMDCGGRAKRRHRFGFDGRPLPPLANCKSHHEGQGVSPLRSATQSILPTSVFLSLEGLPPSSRRKLPKAICALKIPSTTPNLHSPFRPWTSILFGVPPLGGPLPSL